MSYRVYVNHKQLFGNNESYKEWDDFIRSQGIKIGPDGNYEGYIKDFNGAMRAVEQIVERLIKERHEQIVKGEKWYDVRDDEYKEYHELGDYSNILKEVEKQKGFCASKYYTLQYYLREMIESGYFFLPYRLYDICRNKLIDHFVSYEVKGKRGIRVSAG